MKTNAWLFTLVLCGCTSTGLAANPPATPGLLDFIASRRDRQFNAVPHEVLAFYYTWYGRPERHGHWIHWGGEDAAAHEIPQSTHYPTRGAYDSQDPEVITAHIAEAKAHGVTGFIATWWGQGGYEDRAFQLLLDYADQENFKTAVYWETAPGKGQEQIHHAIGDLAYLLKHYGSRRSFLKVEGKPVIFVYGRVMDEVPLASWPAIITGARAQAGDFLLIADGYTESFARLFDGVHTYNNCAQVAGQSPALLHQWSARHYTDAVNLARRQGKISCVTVIPGYDDTKIRTPGLNAARQDGQTYRVLWEEALKSNPDWVLITSWNEWHEGSEIEPSWEDGESYLKLTAEYAPRFRTRTPDHATATTTSGIDAESREKLQSLFKDRTIGVLPGFGDTVFWLLDAGLDVKELSWADVADPDRFNPRTFPLVLQAGGEHYSSTGKTAGDVVPALQHYLAQGGFLLSLPDGPFPFYYDDITGHPQPVANLLDLPVQGGWERPPTDAKLVFHFNTNALPSLPATAPFPTTGDLRWRPANRSAAARDALYTPLASLEDSDGHDLGDAIAYVEQRSPPSQSGRTLYAWMRMSDVAGQNQLLLALLEFAGKKLDERP